MNGENMQKPKYKQFEDPKLQAMVEREIESRIRISTYPAKSITAFIAQNFKPDDDMLRILVNNKINK